jgi:hypothetical protein
MTSRGTGGRRTLPNSPFGKAEPSAERTETYDVGDQVCHDRHGLGRVIQITGTSELVADFGSTVRRIALPSAKLTKL